MHIAPKLDGTSEPTELTGSKRNSGFYNVRAGSPQSQAPARKQEHTEIQIRIKRIKKVNWNRPSRGKMHSL